VTDGRGGRSAGAAADLRAVLFDVDFTLARPGPELGADGYVRVARRYGMELDPARYEQARTEALEGMQRHPELMHDEEIWYAFAERIVRGMGGDLERARECAVEIELGWERSENFDLYEDALPVLDELRSYGLKLGLVSNGARDLDEFVAHHAIRVDAAIGSRSHGRTKPHPTIFRAALERLGVEAHEAVMVGDSHEDDLEGARALGMRAFLVDRENRHPEAPDRLPNLYALPAALGLRRPG
jgi:HAD superfamily hydrolase (TIGR01549 family)